jgi:hypothetical protein
MCSNFELKRLRENMRQLKGLDRRRFLQTAAAAGCGAAACLAWGLPRSSKNSAAFRLVEETDRARILAAGSHYLPQEPLTITAFPTKRSAGGLHDFYSQADYFWPNPKDTNGPYINRDGQSNPDNFDDHRKAMVALSIQMPALTAAWLLTGDLRYGKWACDHLRAWFVTPATRMNPNLQFAQAVQGVSTGRSYGIIDTLHLVEVDRAASFLTPHLLSAQDSAGVKDWFCKLSRLAMQQRSRQSGARHQKQPRHLLGAAGRRVCAPDRQRSNPAGGVSPLSGDSSARSTGGGRIVSPGAGVDQAL